GSSSMWTPRCMPRRRRSRRTRPPWLPASPATWGSRHRRSMSRPRPTRAWATWGGARASRPARWRCWREPRNLERAAADGAVACAQTVGQQRVQDAQGFFGAAAHVEIVDRHVLDDVVRIDDEGGAQCDAFGLFADAQRIDQRTRRIAELVVVELDQFGAVAPPGKLDVFVVCRAAHEHGAARLEFVGQSVEDDELGGPHLGEVLGVEIDHLPLPEERRFRDLLQDPDAAFLGLVEAGHDAGDAQGRGIVAYVLHQAS